MNETDKICVISFDEMHLSECINLDKRREKVIGPYKTVQVIFLRGLIAKWQQIIYYSFDQTMTIEILNKVICKTEDCGYHIVAMTNDMGPGNMSVWRNLKITISNTYFSNPHDISKNIYVFADAPHLIKLTRKNFIDQGFILNNKRIDISCLLNTY